MPAARAGYVRRLLGAVLCIEADVVADCRLACVMPFGLRIDGPLFAP